MKRDVYDKAIDIVIEECYRGDESIHRAWIRGGDGHDTGYSGLLFLSCPAMHCCLTEWRDGQGRQDLKEDPPQVLADLTLDSDMPIDSDELTQLWSMCQSDEEQARGLLGRFAEYNRRLDVEFPERLHHPLHEDFEQ